MQKKIVYLMTAGVLAFQNCSAMREAIIDIICHESDERLYQAIFDKTDRGYCEKTTIDGVRAGAYDIVIDKFEEQIPLGIDEHFFIIYTGKFSSRFYKYVDDVCVIDDHILAINQHAFSYNWWFTRVQLPQNLIAIGSMAFAYSDLEEVDIPDSVVAIAPLAFAKCEKLRRVTLSKNTIICNWAFAMSPNVVLTYRDAHRSQHGV